MKTAKNYLGGKTKTDPVRLAYLQAVVGKKIIPEQAPVWWCSRKKMLFCDSGWGMGAAQLGNMFYLAELRDRSIDYMKVQTKALRAEIEALNNEVKALKLEAAPKPAALPSNIIEFKLRSKR
ncbi:MAG: hypothetical protein KBT88_03465 [Gammaproteobacteria bacterium]|nr:hypothetical protein [Gammaproteobacteria bacterium]MBQ0838819.1 hypothetical protein [Gammaproteobacteria bacterium]